jgi:hypothetical protein
MWLYLWRFGGDSPGEVDVSVRHAFDSVALNHTTTLVILHQLSAPFASNTKSIDP